MTDSWEFFFSAAPTAHNSPELHFCLVFCIFFYPTISGRNSGSDQLFDIPKSVLHRTLVTFSVGGCYHVLIFIFHFLPMKNRFQCCRKTAQTVENSHSFSMLQSTWHKSLGSQGLTCLLTFNDWLLDSSHTQLQRDQVGTYYIHTVRNHVKLMHVINSLGVSPRALYCVVDTRYGLGRSLGDCRPGLPKGQKYQIVNTQTESHVRRPVV